MSIKETTAVFMLLMIPAWSYASGYRPPAHSQLTYSFTCPTGTSGHLSYTKDFVDEHTSRLTIWVNGKYIHDDAKLAALLDGKNIEQVQASCGAGATLIFVETFQPGAKEGTGLRVITIYVDSSGNISSVG